MAKKKKQSKFSGRVNKNVQKQKSEKTGFGYLNLPDGVELYKPTPGERENFDIIPYTITDKHHPDLDEDTGLVVGEEWYRRPFKVHRGIGAKNDTFVCLTSFGEKCPICEYRALRAKEGASQDELKAFYTSNRNLYVVVPRGIKKIKEEYHIFDFSQFNFQDLLNDELEENEDYEVFPDLEDGLTLRVRWSEETFQKNKFAKANRIDFINRKDAIDIEELGEVPNLDKVLKKLSYKELEAKFLEIDHSQNADEDEDEDDEPVKKSKKEKKPPFEEDEDEDDNVDDGNGNSGKVKKSTIKEEAKKKKSKKEPEPEPEEEDELTWDDLTDMDETELAEVVEEKELDLDVDDYEDDEDGLREAIAEELEIEKPKKKDKKKKLKSDEEENPKKTKKTTSPSKENKCPVKGGTFGKSTDDFDECDSCKLYDACEKANYK